MKNIILLLMLAIAPVVIAQETDYIQLMLERMNNSTFAIADSKRPVPSESVNETNLLAALDKFNSDGSYIIALPIITEEEKFNSESEYDEHMVYLKDLRSIAQLYGLNNYYSGKISSANSGKQEYKELVYNSLKWYFANKLPPKSVYHSTFNYHDYSATVVGLLEYIGMLLHDDFFIDMTTDESIATLHANMVEFCHHMVTDNPQSRGPNWSFRYGNCMRHVVFSNSTDEMDDFMETNNASLDFDPWAVNGTDGIWPDWSLTHHGDMNYWGMYGTSWLANTLELARVVKGTPWEYSTEKIQFIETSIIEGLQWILYRGNCEITTAPKRLTYWLARTDGIAGEVINQLQILVELHGDKLKKPDEIQSLIQNIDPSWMESDTDATRKELVGHKYFWNTEYEVHRRHNFSIAVRRTSMRVRGPEDSSNSDVRYHLHYGSGYTSILRTGNEYRLARLGMDYQSLAGTTTERNGIINAGKSASTRRGINMFSGGVYEGNYGAGAFEMKLGIYDDNKWSLINGAGALKGNFFFDNEMVCLGQEVNRIAAGTNEIWTTINQIQRVGDVVYSIDDAAEIDIALGQRVATDINVNNKAWFWHDDIGYIINTDSEISLKLLAEKREHDVELIKDVDYVNALSAEDRAAGTINMLQLAINHGVNPDKQKYNYVVVPNVNLQAFKNYMTENEVIVAANTDSIQAVFSSEDMVFEAVFYKPGTVTFDNGKSLTVDKASVILLRQDEDSLFVSAANPVHRGLTPSFVDDGTQTIGELYTTPIEVTLSGFSLLHIDSEPNVVLLQMSEERAYEGGTETTKLILEENGGFAKVEKPELTSLKVDGEEISGFYADLKEYYIDIALEDNPVVTAFADEKYTVEIVNAESDTVLIYVSDDERTVAYTVYFLRSSIPQLDEYVETFTNFVNTGSWTSTTYVGDNNISWTVNAAKYATYQGTGPGIYIRGGYVVSEELNTGIGSFSVSLYNKWNSAFNVVRTGLYVNNNLISTIENSTDGQVYNFSVEDVNIAGDVYIKLMNLSDENTTLVIDNISWTPYDVPNKIENISSNISKVYPNPFSDSFVVTNTSGFTYAKLYNMSGRLIKNMEVRGQQQIQMGTNMANGVYILTLQGDLNTEVYKIIKK